MAASPCLILLEAPWLWLLHRWGTISRVTLGASAVGWRHESGHCSRWPTSQGWSRWPAASSPAAASPRRTWGVTVGGQRRLGHTGSPPAPTADLRWPATPWTARAPEAYTRGAPRLHHGRIRPPTAAVEGFHANLGVTPHVTRASFPARRRPPLTAMGIRQPPSTASAAPMPRRTDRRMEHRNRQVGQREFGRARARRGLGARIVTDRRDRAIVRVGAGLGELLLESGESGPSCKGC